MDHEDKSLTPSERILASRRKFLQKAGFGGAAAVAGTLAAPAIVTVTLAACHWG